MTMMQHVSTSGPRHIALPNLFGRLTAVWLDHGELIELLPRLEEMCLMLDSGRTVPPPSLHPSRLVENLKARLARHFEAEETSGYFGTIAKQRPELLPAIVALKADHVAMLDELEALDRLAGDFTQWTRLSKRARALTSFLRQHDAAEADLMRRFLSADDDAVKLHA